MASSTAINAAAREALNLGNPAFEVLGTHREDDRQFFVIHLRQRLAKRLSWARRKWQTALALNLTRELTVLGVEVSFDADKPHILLINFGPEVVTASRGPAFSVLRRLPFSVAVAIQSAIMARSRRV